MFINATPISEADMHDALNRLVKPFPIMLFAVVMGLAGLTIAVEKAAPLFGLPHWTYGVLLGLVSALFALILLLYALKIANFPDAVRAELHHPVKLNFFSTIPISFLLVSIAFYNEVNPLLGILFWYVGTPLQFVMLLFVFSRWIRHDFDLATANPAWFIPIVGTLLVPVVGVDVAPPFVSIFFFSIGLFFWLAMFSIIFYRLIFHAQLHQRFVPTLFIFIAPPAVALIAYFRITGVVDLFAYVLYSLALFFLLVLLSMGPHFRLPRFFLSWWAYTFPLAAVTIASTLLYEVGRDPVFGWLAGLCLALATFVVGYVSFATLREVRRGTLFAED